MKPQAVTVKVSLNDMTDACTLTTRSRTLRPIFCERIGSKQRARKAWA